MRRRGRVATFATARARRGVVSIARRGCWPVDPWLQVHASHCEGDKVNAVRCLLLAVSLGNDLSIAVRDVSACSPRRHDASLLTTQDWQTRGSTRAADGGCHCTLDSLGLRGGAGQDEVDSACWRYVLRGHSILSVRKHPSTSFCAVFLLLLLLLPLLLFSLVSPARMEGRAGLESPRGNESAKGIAVLTEDSVDACTLWH